MMMQPTTGAGPPPPPPLGSNTEPTQQQHQQQWMAMQQQQAPMQMQQQPFHGQQQSGDEIKTLWVGDLQYWMDENYLLSCFSSNGEVVASVKIIRNKQTGQPEGYGFVELDSRATAERILQNFQGTPMPNAQQPFRLNWATFGAADRRTEPGTGYSIFVGDLGPEVTDILLQETFQSRYSSVKGAKVVIDANTGRTKGYGFVRFGDENEKNRAMTEMNGVYCSSRPMRINEATPKKSLGFQQPYSMKGNYYTQTYGGAVASQGFQSDNDPNNTTIFVGGLDPNATDEDLRQVFGPYGEIVYVKIPVGKGCGFVQFTNRSSAEEALQKLHGTVIGQQSIRLSWGRSPANKQTASWGVQPQPDPNQWNGGGAYYNYGQGYEAYGYAPPPQDPAMYGYGGFPGYGTYQQQ